MENVYYIYIMYDSLDVPFYVGRGSTTKWCPEGFRPSRHVLEAIRYGRSGKASPKANLHKLRTILKILGDGSTPRIEIFARHLSKEEAYRIEMECISRFGRRDIGSGTLTNLTDGGDGAFGISPEVRRKISETQKGRPSKFKGTKLGPYSPDRIEAARNGILRHLQENPRSPNLSLRGRQLPEEVRQKISDALKGRPSPMKGRVPYNKGKSSPLKGLSYEEIHGEEKGSELRKRKVPWNKGKSSNTKGLTYEEIYGEEKASELRSKRRAHFQKYWNDKRDVS